MVNVKVTTNIILHVNRIDDILSKSSIPLSSKRLINREVEKFLIEEASKMDTGDDIVVSIRTKDSTLLSDDEVVSIIQMHFAYCSARARQKLSNILKLGWKSLFIAFVFLMAMYLLTKAMARYLPEGTLMVMLRELFIILGWVALWRPADLLLYEWRPYKRKVKLFRKLSDARVEIL